MQDKENKKLYSILFLTGLIIVFVMFVSYLKDNYLDNYFNQSGQKINQSEGSNFLETYDPIKNAKDDNDYDGVSNWREIAEGTDPDSKNFSGNSQSKNSDNLKDQITATSNLTFFAARDLYVISKYKEKYPNMNIDTLSDSVAKNYESLIMPTRTIDLNIVNNNERSYVKNYANVMSQMFNTIFSNSDFIELKELEENLDQFTETKIYLKQVIDMCNAVRYASGIPASYTSLHKDFIYNCDLYTNIINGLITNKTDKIRALISLKKHQEVMINILNNFNSFVEKLKQENIVFSTKDSGYIFTNKIN